MKLKTETGLRLMAAFALLMCSTIGSTLMAQTEPFDATKLESRIQKVVEQVMPATVAIRSEAMPGDATGVIITREGHVATAGHCVSDPGSRFTILLPDGREFPAVGLGRESTLDCGLLKIDEDAINGVELPMAEMGWSAELKVNQPCISLGHSGGYNKTRGPAVRFGRIANIATRYNGAIQSTCLMEPGDSGGPLFDMNGRVIGIHSMIQENLDENFEVPIDLFRRYWTQLNKKETFRATRLDNSPFGLKLIRSRNSAMSMGPDSNEKKVSRGVKITRITPDGWADTQGLAKGDRLLRIGNHPVSNSAQVEVLLYRSFLTRQKNVELKLRRDGEPETVVADFSGHPVDSDNPLTSYRCIKENQISPIPQLEDLGGQFGELESRVDDFCVQIESKLNDKSRTVFGTAVSLESQTLFFAKSSLIGESPKVMVGDSDSTIDATVVARDDESDLALLQADIVIKAIPVANLGDKKTSLDHSCLLVTPSPRDEGEVSVLGSTEFSALGPGFLGIMPDMKDEQVVLREVIEDGAAEKAGLMEGDRVQMLDGQTIHSPPELVGILSMFSPGETVRITVLRDEEEMTFDVELGARSREDSEMSDMEGMHVADSFSGGKSRIRTGFPIVLVHDGRVRPNECGGPVFNIAGEFVGINIARHSRTQCYIIPRRVLASMLETFLDHSGEVPRQ